MIPPVPLTDAEKDMMLRKAAESQRPTLPLPRGLCCPRCGETRLPALYTRRQLGAVVRVRKCKGCGQRVVTRERVQSYGGLRPAA